MRLPIRDVDPPKLLFIISKVRTMNTMGHARLPTQSFLSLINSSLEPGPLLLLLVIFTSNILLTLISLIPLTTTFFRNTLLPFTLTPALTSPFPPWPCCTFWSLNITSLFLFCCSTFSSCFWLRCCSFLLLFARLARLLGLLLLLRLLPCRAFFLILLFFLSLPISNIIFLVINQVLIISIPVFTFILFSKASQEHTQAVPLKPDCDGDGQMRKSSQHLY